LHFISFKSYTTQAIGNFKKSTTAIVTSQNEFEGLMGSTMAVSVLDGNLFATDANANESYQMQIKFISFS